ncbi:DUF4158 domain-containing protein [Sphingobium sp. Z007]|uniref:DUF4158 domain-containing protein n=1 Tax=Sphingobium sp. Z007 TaxID=627495 RepID=UPI0011818862|nr:DUF4158 domain-containing protein [Sphingobium sp. Z007]MBH2000008.1 DUF4158 domain-containing protein [Sphingomonadaceae bacterium]
MDRSISGGDLIGRWSLSFADIDFVNSKPALTRLGLAAQLKFFASLGFFATDPGSIPTDGLSYLAEQLGVEAGEIAGYDFSSRTARRHCAEILIHLGYHRMKRGHRAQLTEWSAGELCPGGHRGADRRLSGRFVASQHPRAQVRHRSIRQLVSAHQPDRAAGDG